MVPGSDWFQLFFPKEVLPNIKLRVPIILSSAFCGVLCGIVSDLTFLLCLFVLFQCKQKCNKWDGVLGVIGSIPPPPNTASWVWPQHFHPVLLWITGTLQTGCTRACPWHPWTSLWSQSWWRVWNLIDWLIDWLLLWTGVFYTGNKLRLPLRECS